MTSQKRKRIYLVGGRHDNEKRDGRSQMVKGNGTMADLIPSCGKETKRIAIC